MLDAKPAPDAHKVQITQSASFNSSINTIIGSIIGIADCRKDMIHFITLSCE